MTDFSLEQFSVIVPHSARPGTGPIRRSVLSIGPQLSLPGGVTTMYENFQRAVVLGGDRPCMGYRPINSKGEAQDFVFQTYNEINSRIMNFGSALVNRGLLPPNMDNMKLLGIYSKNCVEWVIAEQACYTYGAVPVPLYDTLGAESVEYVVNQTSLATVVCRSTELAAVVSIAPNCPSLKAVVQIDGNVDPSLASKASAVGLQVFTFAEMEMEGSGALCPPTPPHTSDVATFCYTSGTTGDPKGALITHANIISDYSAAQAMGVDVGAEDVHLSYLPLPHMFERLMQFGVVAAMASIGFYQGDTLKLLDDIKALRPTVFPSVPRLLNRIHDKLRAGVEEKGGVAKALFERGYGSKLYYLHNGGHYTHRFWDKLIFGKLRTQLGFDRLRLMFTGSAPISASVLDFLRVVFCCPVMEGYGQTECAAAASLTSPLDTTTGHVGGVLPCNEIRLEDVSEMGYLSSDTVHGADAEGRGGIPCDGRGEICFRGLNVFKGYYKMPEKTAEAVDSEGWLHSGDIGLWTPDGKLKIIDRKKNIFKLSQGEYVAAEKIENVYLASAVIAQCFVYGDSLQSRLVAVVVPDEEAFPTWAAGNGLKVPAGDWASVCADPQVKKAILAEMTSRGKAAGLKGFEFVRAIHVEPEVMSVDNGMLTPTFKLKRPQARDHYREVIDGLYATLALAEPKAKL